MKAVVLTPATTRLDTLFEVIRQPDNHITLSRQAQSQVDRSAAIVERVALEDHAVYGINTGFGKLASVRIASEDTATLQRNLILSHCAGVGAPASESIVRMMMVLKLLSLGRGASGVRWLLIEQIERLLNAGITPVVPMQGSVGASGDLAPLAHFAAALMGEGEAVFQQQRQPSIDALKKAGITPITLCAKEGLALINGTQFSTAAALVSLAETWKLACNGIITSACLLYTSPSPRDS